MTRTLAAVLFTILPALLVDVERPGRIMSRRMMMAAALVVALAGCGSDDGVVRADGADRFVSSADPAVAGAIVTDADLSANLDVAGRVTCEQGGEVGGASFELRETIGGDLSNEQLAAMLVAAYCPDLLTGDTIVPVAAASDPDDTDVASGPADTTPDTDAAVASEGEVAVELSDGSDADEGSAPAGLSWTAITRPELTNPRGPLPDGPWSARAQTAFDELLALIDGGAPDADFFPWLDADCRVPGFVSALRGIPIGNRDFIDSTWRMEGVSNGFEVQPFGADGVTLRLGIADWYGATATSGFVFDSETRDLYLRSFDGSPKCKSVGDDGGHVGDEFGPERSTAEGMWAAFQSTATDALTTGDLEPLLDFWRMDQCSRARMRDRWQVADDPERRFNLDGHFGRVELVAIADDHVLVTHPDSLDDDGSPIVWAQLREREYFYRRFDPTVNADPGQAVGWFIEGCPVNTRR